MKKMLKRSLGVFLVFGMVFYGVMMNVMAEENFAEKDAGQSDNILTSESAVNLSQEDAASFEKKTANIDDNGTLTDTENSDDASLQTMTLFTPRLTQPAVNDYHYFSNNNIYYKYGYGMPNCTCYAWGRAYELLGATPNLSTGNANSFWGTNISRGAYAHGSTPKLGAIACWGNGYGHVAVVEKIEGNVVTVSESGASVGQYTGFMFRTSTYTIGSENSRSPGGFQGYIYLGNFSSASPTPTPSTPWSGVEKTQFVGTDMLKDNQCLLADQYIMSQDGRFVLIMQGDGNCVLYGMGGTAYWSSGTAGHPGANLVVQSDGNIVIYQNNQAIWATNTNAAADFIMQNDGNLVAYSNSGAAVWDSKTGQMAVAHSSVGNSLISGETLNSGQYMVSSDHRCYTLMQEDGNLVVYGPGYKVYWSSGTAGNPGANLVAQSDGNIVIYRNGQAKWATNTNAAADFIMQNDGNFVAYTNSEKAVWLSQTSNGAESTISNVEITDINEDGFTVKCKLSNYAKITYVNYTSWTESNGQDDLVKADGDLNNNESSYRVRFKDHNNEQGEYKIAINAYGVTENIVATTTTSKKFDAVKPVISDVEVVDQSPYGYQVKCKVTDNIGISRVQFPTWTVANGQDDLDQNWQTDGAYSGTIEGDTATFTIKDSDHNYERGDYKTNIVAFDEFGNQGSCDVTNNVVNKEVAISEATLDQHKYLLFDDVMTWKEAETKAEELGGTLVTITSQDEQDLVEKLLPAGKRNYYYIGASDEGLEGAFKWITGENFCLGKWASGEPNNAGGNENYLQIQKNGYWNDVKGSTIDNGYIVEVDPGNLGITSFKTTDDSSPCVDRNIGLIAEGSGGVSPLQYKFYYQLGDTKTTIQDFSEANTAAFKPTAVGNYTFYVDVKDSQGRTATRSIANYAVQKTIGISYETHIQNIGWEDDAGYGWRTNGDQSGTTGLGYRLEGIRINLDKLAYDVGVSYQTHIENIGWEADAGSGWKADGVTSGTTGKGLRLEAIQIKLTGADASKFDVYYQVHAENFGWLDWAKNGDSAGTAGFGYRLEAIRIVVVPKGGAAPGAMERSFVSQN